MLKVSSFQIADSIDVKRFKQAFTADLYYGDSDELFYQVSPGKYISIFKYGIVCFLGHTELEITSFIKRITPFSKNLIEQPLSEEFDIETNASENKIGYNKIEITDTGSDVLRLIMLNVSQSVALDHYSLQTQNLLQETNYYTQMLEKKGRLNLSGISLKKYIGRTLNLKNRISENLYIFDSPEETWDDENLNKIDMGLKKTFDLQARFRTIQDGLQIVKENFDLFKNLLQYRKSIVLEWIVIILIFLEVINILVEKVLKK
jgi:uncharacterized Rmd1/YagE family protein